MSKNKIVLAFSGGLDTSFCVPWLAEKGYDVTTLFVDTGGVDGEELEYIAARAKELGASDHRVIDASKEVWDEVVVPLLWAGQWYQFQYPLLCSDRYIIVRKALEICDELGTPFIGHGCTGMGNDQVRFDLTVKALGDYEIVAPVREIQKAHRDVREFELDYLKKRGHGVRAKTSTYTINENLLGVTISGAEIDRWEAPSDEAWQLTANADNWPTEPKSVSIGFSAGKAVTLDGKHISGPQLLATLNQVLAPYGVGRGLYTGDTTVGLKGRVAFEAPAMVALHAAHRALEEAVSSRLQNRFKPLAGAKWVELVYEGFFYEPLKADIEAYLESSQRSVNGTVTLQTAGGSVQAVAIDSDNILSSGDATYAQRADWSVEEATGFIRLYGQSSQLWGQVNRKVSKSD
ncbi:MAG: argininosuccinate synthase [Gammaproteobacteria bacterium]|nr:argininosuccinate synthase [Gammaproteobacteria bacterium]